MNQQILEQDLENYKKEQKEQIIECAKQNAHNNNQIKIIEQIIDRCYSKKEVQQIISLLTSRIKLGFVFDESPIIKSKNIITILEKDNDLSFGPRERERESCYRSIN